MLSLAPLLFHFQQLIYYPSAEDDFIYGTPLTMPDTDPTLVLAPPHPTHLHQSTVSPLTATSIPEITALIASHLAKSDIATCTLVCRVFTVAYTPHLWRIIRARIPNPYNASILPGLLAKYGALIRTLSIRDLPEHFLSRAEPTMELVFDCRGIENLVHLTVVMEKDKKKAIRSILERNSGTLRQLSLTLSIEKTKKNSGLDVQGDENLLDFPKLNTGGEGQGRGMQCLQGLSLENWSMSRKELIEILRACPALKTLSLSGIRFTDAVDLVSDTNTRSLQETTSFQHSSIETFKMCTKLYPILDLLPRVKTLEFYRFDRAVDAELLSDFCLSIRTHCRHLSHVWSFGFECSMLPDVLDSVPRLIDFRGSSDLTTVLSILDHAETLEEANLSDYTERTFLPLKFLENCPRLKEFRTGHSSTTIAEVRDSVERRGWACKGLRVLRLSVFKMSPALIEAVMRDLNAERSTDLSTRTLASATLASSSTSPTTMTTHGTETGARIGEVSSWSSTTPGAVTTPEASIAEHQAQAYLRMKRQLEQQLQAAISSLTEEQQEFRRLFSGYLRELRYLVRVNFGSGWYSIPRPDSSVVCSSDLW